jgi:23S rRNA-/tRNA-specific pseudouridylate synthase
VLGDDVYGNRDANRAVKMPGLMLCAARLAFKNLDGLPGLSGKQFSIDPTF